MWTCRGQGPAGPTWASRERELCADSMISVRIRPGREREDRARRGHRAGHLHSRRECPCLPGRGRGPGGGRTFAGRLNTTGLVDRKASRTSALRVSGRDSAACCPASGEAGARLRVTPVQVGQVEGRFQCRLLSCASYYQSVACVKSVQVGEVVFKKVLARTIRPLTSGGNFFRNNLPCLHWIGANRRIAGICKELSWSINLHWNLHCLHWRRWHVCPPRSPGKGKGRRKGELPSGGNVHAATEVRG
jgi:hypothetical protein